MKKWKLGAVALTLSLCFTVSAMIIDETDIDDAPEVVLSANQSYVFDGSTYEYYVDPGDWISIKFAPPMLGSEIHYSAPSWISASYNNNNHSSATEITLSGHTTESGRYEVHLAYKQLQFNSGVSVYITVGGGSPSTPNYTITFDSRGGSQVNGQTLLSGGKIIKPVDPTKSGYTFVKWSKDGNATFDFNTPIYADTTLYAVWEANKYNITFNSNGGSSVANQLIGYGSSVIKPEDPTKEGYVFSGWYTDQLFKNSYNFNSSVYSSLTLYAKWEAVQTVYHTVTFNSNGGIFDDGSELREVTQVAGTKFTVPAAISRDGYILASYSNPHGTLNPGTEYDIDLLDGHTFYADWTPLNHTVSFVTLGGSALDDQSVATGGKVIKPEDPTKEGYVFSGWYSDAELTSEYDFNSEIDDNITLYAKWDAATENTDSQNHNMLLFWISFAVIIALAAGLFSGGRKHD